VEANARLTGMTAALLLVLLAVEGFTILRIGKLLTLHVVIGMVLVPPVLLKIGSTSPPNARSELLTIHKATFILWIAAMVVHVLGHLVDTARLAPKDFYRRTRRQVRGASTRQWALVGALCLGLVLAVVVAPKVGPWRSGGTPVHLITPAGKAGASTSGQPGLRVHAGS
jgi:hypothetical protein